MKNTDLENKQESLRLLFYKILQIFFIGRNNNNKKHNSKTQARVFHSLLSAKKSSSLQQ